MDRVWVRKKTTLRERRRWREEKTSAAVPCVYVCQRLTGIPTRPRLFLPFAGAIRPSWRGVGVCAVAVECPAEFGERERERKDTSNQPEASPIYSLTQHRPRHTARVASANPKGGEFFFIFFLLLKGWGGVSTWPISLPVTYRADVHELAGADVVGVDQEGTIVVIEKLAELIVVSLLDLENSGGRHLVVWWWECCEKKRKKKRKRRYQADLCRARIDSKLLSV